jgi:hypothetical protein
MESIRRLMPLILVFLVITVALASYALGLEDMINEFDIKVIEKSFINYNWKYSH